MGTFNFKELSSVLNNKKLENSPNLLISESALPTSVQHNTILEIV